MAEPINLVTRSTAEKEVKAEIVQLLREALAEAEAGDIECLVMILGHPDKEWTKRCSGATRFSETIGRIEIIKQEWIAQFTANRGKS